MRCYDMVMHAMSCHPRQRCSRPARLFWEFVARWQRSDGRLHRRHGHWHMIELASRYDFPCVREILRKSLTYAASRQRGDGDLDRDDPAGCACRAVLAYSRQDMLQDLLLALPHDPLPLVRTLETPLGIKTRREALEKPDSGDPGLARRLASRIRREQAADGSWRGLITATADGIEDLLDCGVAPDVSAIRRACDWLTRQQRCPDKGLFRRVPATPIPGMFYGADLRGELDYLGRGPRHCPRSRGEASCLVNLPIYQTGDAVAALCRAGLVESPAVKAGFAALLMLRGIGYTRQPRYTDFWCACNARTLVDKDVPRFDQRSSEKGRVITP